jgi:hypothetical protein
MISGVERLHSQIRELQLTYTATFGPHLYLVWRCLVVGMLTYVRYNVSTTTGCEEMDVLI